MPIPEFIVALRSKIGNAPLWLSGVTAVVVRDPSAGNAGELLLVRATEESLWAPVTGIIDPGEQPADAAVREVAEETTVTAVPLRLSLIDVTDPIIYSNGDCTQYLDLTFRMAWSAGEPFPADGENIDAAWFPLDALPELNTTMKQRVSAALAPQTGTQFLHKGQIKSPR